VRVRAAFAAATSVFVAIVGHGFVAVAFGRNKAEVRIRRIKLGGKVT
jgi:hypothetical protein